MRHRRAGRALSRSRSHRGALTRTQVTDLLRHERIITTEAKAKSLRPVAEKVITLGKRGTLHARRQAAAVLTDRKVVKRLFEDIAPRFTDRPGGYTRIIKLGPRRGDGALMAQIELVERDLRRPASVAPARATAAAVVDEPVEEEAPLAPGEDERAVRDEASAELEDDAVEETDADEATAELEDADAEDDAAADDEAGEADEGDEEEKQD